MTTNNQQNSRVMAEAEKLIRDMKQANKRFAARTNPLIEEMNHNIKKAESELVSAERDLKKLEREAVTKMDAAVLNFLSEG